MTEQERIDAFRRALEEAARRYGVTLEAVAQAEQLGPVVQVRAVLRLQTRDGWQGEPDGEV